VLVYGDLSFDHGDTNDYRLLKELVQTAGGPGVRWHACFGNHDRRGPFFSVFPERKDATPLVPDRLVTVVKKRRTPISSCWIPASKAPSTAASIRHSGLGCRKP